MSLFDDRRFEILIDGESVIVGGEGRQLKITFSITVDFGGHNSYCDISLFNLGDTFNKLKRGSLITIKAGYKNTIDIIFSGAIKNILREREGPSTIARLICIDSAINPTSISKQMGHNASIVEVITYLAEQMNLTLVINKDDFSDVPRYGRGYQLFGDAYNRLIELGSSHNFGSTVERGKLIVNRNGGSRLAAPIVIDQFSGMEGIPEISEIGCDVSVRLNPVLKIGMQVDVRSYLKTFNFSNLYYQNVPAGAGTGMYTVDKMEHSGDSWGDDWTTKIEGRSKSADI